MNKVYLSRRNLLALLSKLDRVKNGEHSECTLIKNDNIHHKYPQTMSSIHVVAIEDEEYYSERIPGEIYSKDVK